MVEFPIWTLVMALYVHFILAPTCNRNHFIAVSASLMAQLLAGVTTGAVGPFTRSTYASAGLGAAFYDIAIDLAMTD